jgi:hypothetical protein
MLKEAIDAIKAMAIKNVEPKWIDNNGNKGESICLMADGTQVKIALDPPPREHIVNSLEDFIAIATHFDGITESVVVWHDLDEVVAVLDDGDHRQETVMFELKSSDQYVKLVEINNRKFDQKSFIRLLRIDLAGCLPVMTLLDPVRHVTIENGTLTQSAVEKQRESIDRTVKAQVRAKVELPEEVTLSVPIYKTRGEDAPYPFRMFVEVEPMDSQPFRLTAYPNEHERVLGLHLADMAARLKAGLPDTVRVYHGTP